MGKNEIDFFKSFEENFAKDFFEKNFSFLLNQYFFCKIIFGIFFHN